MLQKYFIIFLKTGSHLMCFTQTMAAAAHRLAFSTTRSISMGRSRHRPDDHFPRHRRPPLRRRIDADRTVPVGEVLQLLLLPLSRID